ncbi:terpene synthase family protein [Streptomyces alkaliterrae]|uniref:Terpene synthase n=1 Tax=Streptomyces alkaliterrae TaxID=2213162 RepID=A0A5P0YYU2_9ACTN|nr:terpene synthase family protein [Streptomyces alkaliterrae]MBB1256052.1 hypothetical protein [Streptomyces alkaliterrae]MBB1261777.1 hypothetical protein [Streptomyces alkaliterrae]MQS05454.1 hypothetical protein [Streptomyces alkaliterrae]
MSHTTTVPRTDGFQLPLFPRSLPVVYHPHAAQTEFRSNAWVRRHLESCCTSQTQLMRLLRQRVGLYGPLVAPLTDRDRVLALADFYHFVGLIDDLAADHTAGLGASPGGARAAFDRITAEFGNPDTATSPFGRAAADLWQRMSPDLSGRQQHRFQESLATFLQGIAAELPYQLTGTVPDYSAYIDIRLASFGCDFICLLNEYAAAVDLTDLLRTPELRAVHDHAMRQMILVNDVLSLRKEHGDPMNAVRVLEYHDRLPLQQAVDEVAARAAAHEHGYIQARDAARGHLGGQVGVDAYLRAMDHLLAGAQEFEYLTPRYLGDGAVWDGSTTGWISLEPADPAATNGLPS